MTNYYISILSFLLLTVQHLNAQVNFNTSLRDQLRYTQDLNDIWGYVAPDGTEYALVGTKTGLSIVSLADPDNINQVAFIGGDNAIWRDIKTYGNYAYVVADQGNDGLLIVDLSNLPNSVSHQYYNLSVGGSILQRAHNIFIDQSTGFAYIAGANVNSGGMLILDVASTPGQAILQALGPSVYSHDVFVQNNRMYASEINIGELNIYDVSDIYNIVSLSSYNTPYNFTHNAWTTADNNYVFTTDERENAPTAAYDISNPSNPVLIDEFRPARSIGSGTIPHNVHVKDQYLIISHYTDGVEIVDASVPDNLVSIAYYDTWTGADGGFNGCWGAYPFLPSGLVLGTDISEGLFVFDVNYQRAARISGRVTENQANGTPLNNVSVSINNPDGTTTATNITGLYKAGFLFAGSYTITFSLDGYNDITKTIDFQLGDAITLDTFMTLDLSNQSIVSGSVTSSVDNSAIEAAEVIAKGEVATYTAVSNTLGAVSFSHILHDDYTIFSGKWGFENRQQAITVNSPATLNFELTPGYLDGFAVDQGWTSSSNGATTGFWERAIPNGTSYNGAVSNPDSDTNDATDIGSTAYITGNGGGTAGADDIDGGTVSLTSPLLDLSIFSDPSQLVISYDYWFFRGGGSTVSSDIMEVIIDNGSDTETIATYSNNTSQWTNVNFNLSDLNIGLTNNMRIIVRAGDTGGGHIVEAGFDDFRIFIDPALPITLGNFELEQMANKSVKLNWTTLNEYQNNGFVIEHSTDGRQFKRIGWVNGVVNSNETQQYSFIDYRPILGDNYYRLRQEDLSGLFSYSPLRFISFTARANKLKVYPNPATTTLYFDAVVDEVTEIYSLDGRLLLRQPTNAEGRIDISSLNNGHYWVKVGQQVNRFQKQ